MADHTFVDGDPLPASDVNTYLNHTGGAWNTYTPVLVQSGGVSVTVNRASYHRAGRAMTASITLAATGAGAANNAITVTLPVTAATMTTNTVLGSGLLFDASPANTYGLTVVYASTTTVAFFVTSSTTNAYAGATGAAFAAALAAGDVITLKVAYEAAAG